MQAWRSFIRFSGASADVLVQDIGFGRTHKGTHVILLIQDFEVRVINAITGELLRELTINPNRDHQPRTPK